MIYAGTFFKCFLVRNNFPPIFLLCFEQQTSPPTSPSKTILCIAFDVLDRFMLINCFFFFSFLTSLLQLHPHQLRLDAPLAGAAKARLLDEHAAVMRCPCHEALVRVGVGAVREDVGKPLLLPPAHAAVGALCVFEVFMCK